MFQDLRLALRTLAKSPGFSAVCILTLAVGIGATAAMFSTLQALVVKPFSYPASDRLVHVWSGDYWPLSEPDFLDLRTQATSFAEFGCYSPQRANVGGENPQSIQTVAATSGVLRAFGVQPVRGRLLEPEDDKPGSREVVVISHGLWQRSFGGDPDLVGKTIRLNGADVPVVGIMPELFEFCSPWLRAADCDAWMPFRPRTEAHRGSHSLLGIARMKDGVPVDAADAEIKAIGVRLKETYPDTNTHKKFLVRSLRQEMTRDVGSRVVMLFAAVALVLVVACSNVASMLLARSARRQGEFGVRIALGASRLEIVRLALNESLLLSLAGAAAGLLVAFGGVQVLRVIVPLSEARRAAIALDGEVVLFAIGLAAVATLLAGLPPALAAARTSVTSMLRDTGGRSCAGSRTRHLFLRSLVVAQISVAFILANGAALFSTSYLKLLQANELLSTGFVVAAELDLRGERYNEAGARARFWEQLAERTAALPGVTSAGITSKLPLEGGSNTTIMINDEVFDPAAERRNAEVSSVTPEYFAVAGLALLRGRTLEDGDANPEALGVVVNKALVDKCWPGEDGLGKIIRGNNASPWFTARIVGVVEDVRQWGPEQDPQPELYWAPVRAWGRSIHLVARSPHNALQLAPAIRQTVASLDPDLPIRRVRTLAEVVDQATAGQRVIAGIVGFFMAVALGLVAVGIYGTLSYHVLQRTREIGVRMALGAVRRDVARLVFGQGTRWVAVGVMIGAAGALAATRVLRSLIYGVGTLDLLSLLAAAALVAVATAAACLIPAWRATRVLPTEALRTD